LRQSGRRSGAAYQPARAATSSPSIGGSISSGHRLLSLTEDFSWHSIWYSC
jgi:hypothetical protein